MESNNKSPYMSRTELDGIGLPKDFLKFVNLHFTDNYFDIYEPIRKYIIDLNKQNQRKNQIVFF